MPGSGNSNKRPKRPGAKSDGTRHFLNSLNRLKRSRRMHYRSEAPDFAAELQDLLVDLKDASPDPKTGIQLLAKFFEADGKIIEQCDDSDGVVGDVFRIDAQQLFDAYAAACTDKEWLCKVLMKLCAGNEYGLRDHLLDAAGQYLPPHLLRQLATSFLQLGQKELKVRKATGYDFHAAHYFILVETCARQLKDPAFFEWVHMLSHNSATADWCAIAEAFLDAGDTQSALDRVKRDTDSPRGTMTRRDELLLRIHKARGDSKAMAEAASRLFHAERSKENFERLVGLVGESERGRILAEEVDAIQRNPVFDLEHAIFLADMGESAATEAYILKHAAKLDGREFYALPQLADQLAEAGHPLGATVALRALVEVHLVRADTKYYRYGVRYLRELDRVASTVTDWKAVKPHAEYMETLHDKHGRKTRFWELYNKSSRRG